MSFRTHTACIPVFNKHPPIPCSNVCVSSSSHPLTKLLLLPSSTISPRDTSFFIHRLVFTAFLSSVIVSWSTGLLPSPSRHARCTPNPCSYVGSIVGRETPCQWAKRPRPGTGRSLESYDLGSGGSGCGWTCRPRSCHEPLP